MKTLTIIPRRFETSFKLKGLTLKALGSDGHDFYKEVFGNYCVDNSFKTNGDTAMIRLDKLIEYVFMIYENIPFDKIKIQGRYEATGEEIMHQIQSLNKIKNETTIN